MFFVEEQADPMIHAKLDEILRRLDELESGHRATFDRASRRPVREPAAHPRRSIALRSVTSSGALVSR